MGDEEIWVEFDAEKVINKVLSLNFVLSSLGKFYAESLTLMSKLRIQGIKFVSRCCNGVTHNLAHNAPCSSNSFFSALACSSRYCFRVKKMVAEYGFPCLGIPVPSRFAEFI